MGAMTQMALRRLGERIARREEALRCLRFARDSIRRPIRGITYLADLASADAWVDGAIQSLRGKPKPTRPKPTPGGVAGGR